MLEELTGQAREAACRPGFTFEDYGHLFVGLGPERVARMFDRVMLDILESTAERNPPYFDQTHLVSEGDFNLTLKLVGRREEVSGQLVANEFDMLVVNLTEAVVTIPVYHTGISPSAPDERPGHLNEPEYATVEPYGWRLFSAYSEIADLVCADREAPFFVVHSDARGAATWVFDRSTGEPLALTDNHLQSSRVRLAARVMGELEGGPEIVATLERVARSGYAHFVRWEAAESVYKLNPARGTELLREHLADDPHHLIRKAARATLHNIEAHAGLEE